MGQYKSSHTGPQIDAGINAALNPDLVPTTGSDALITSDAVAKVQQGFATIETAATSANSYAIGDLLVWGGILYKAKTSITAGDSFVVDTNIEATTIADKLNNIDTEITSDTDTTLTGLLTGNGSKVGTKSLDTSSLTNDADHVPSSSVVKSAITKVETDLASIRATGSTNTTGAKIDAGTYFYLNGTLVRAKTDIAVNASYTSGTNYETVTAGGLNSRRTVKETLLTNGNETSWTKKTVQNLNNFDFVRLCLNNNSGNADIGSSMIPISKLKSLTSASSTWEAYVPLNSGRRGVKAYYDSDTSVYLITITTDGTYPKYSLYGVNI